MRLPDFSFSSDTLPAIMERAAVYNSWIDKVKAENFIKIGAVGEGELRVLPGIVDNIEVSDGLLEDSVETNGKSGSVKIISGWADADVTITLLLIDIPLVQGAEVIPNVTRFDCLKEIASRFRQMKNGKPCVFTIQHPHLAAWGLHEFVFSNLKSSEARGKRITTCTLEFDEFDNKSGKSQDRQLGAIEAAPEETALSENPTIGSTTRAGLGELEGRYAKL